MHIDDDELDDVLGEEPFDFPPQERKIVTQPYDLSINTLVEQWNEGLLHKPEIQREYIWDNARASRLIESLLTNIPVPPLYFAETGEVRFEVIDGHQRVMSIVRFISNEFKLSGLNVLSAYTGMRFRDLPPREQRYLVTRTLRVIIIAQESHASMKFEVFERLNTGGIILNAQELRNSLYRGAFNDELKELVSNEDFRGCIGTKTPRKRMVDEELVLRFFALRDRLKAYRPTLKRFLNDYMLDFQNPSSAWLKNRREAFERTFQLLNQVLGEQAFRLIDEKGRPLHDKDGKALPRGVNRALFDAQALAFSWVVEDQLAPLRKKILLRVSAALEDPFVQDSVRRATGDRHRLLLRTRAMVEALQAADVSVGVPFNLEK